MYEYDPTGNSVELKAWYSEAVDKIRVSSSPGGIAIDEDEARELRDVLDEYIDG